LLRSATHKFPEESNAIRTGRVILLLPAPDVTVAKSGCPITVVADCPLKNAKAFAIGDTKMDMKSNTVRILFNDEVIILVYLKYSILM
jgi:hypothetical protein